MKEISLHILLAAVIFVSLLFGGVALHYEAGKIDETVETVDLLDSLVNVGDRPLDSLDSLYISRLRALPVSFTLPYNDKVRKYIDDFSSVSAVDMKVLHRRYGKYMPVIDSVLAEGGVPDEMKVIPIMESLLDPEAVSSVTGATGLWQFTDRSAAHYGLVVNDDVDERTDPVKSTRAAVRHLQDNVRAFNGDWLLALAAYNCGVGGVRKALSLDVEKTGWWSLYPHFCRETRDYIARFVALVYIVNYRG